MMRNMVRRMQLAMQRTVAELWPKRSPTTAVSTPEQAVILASIVEKETGKPSERRMVAGLYSNLVRQGMLLQAAADLQIDLDRSFLVGDAVTDVEAALGAGCRPLMVRSGRGQAQLSKLRLQGYEAVIVVADLSEAVELILS